MKVTAASIMKFVLASSADLCQPDLINIGRGPLRAIMLLAKYKRMDACFVGFKQTLLPYKVIAYTDVLIVLHYEITELCLLQHFRVIGV